MIFLTYAFCVLVRPNEPRHEKTCFCICENKDADQLRSDCAADQRLCFRYIDSTVPLLPKYEILSLYPSSVAVRPGLCRFPTGLASRLKLFYFRYLSNLILKTDTHVMHMSKGTEGNITVIALKYTRRSRECYNQNKTQI